MRVLRIFLRTIFGALVIGVLTVASYLAASIAGERWQTPTTQYRSPFPKTEEIRLVTGLLHADIAIKVTPELLERFAFLRKTDLPLNHPNLRYLAFGWGSKAFYTTAGTYSDIELGAVFTAVTGDKAVIRITAFGPLDPGENTINVPLAPDQMDRLLDSIKYAFAETEQGRKSIWPAFPSARMMRSMRPKAISMFSVPAING